MYQTYRHHRDPESFPPKAYANAKPQAPLSDYRLRPEDLGTEDEPLSADHSLRPRAWIKPRKRP